jgi:hypothetical protein
MNLTVTFALLALADPQVNPMPLSRDQIERIQKLGYGSADTPPNAADVGVVLQALTDPKSGAGDAACLAVEKLASKNVFDADSAEKAVRALLPRLRSAQADTSEWSARAVGALASSTAFVKGELLAAAFAEIVLMVGDKEPELRRRGLALAERLLPSLGANEREQTLKAVIAACRRPVAGEAAERAYEIAVRALGHAARHAQGAKAATEAAEELLRAIERKSPDAYTIVFPALGALAARVEEPLRGRIVQAVIVSVRHPGYVYSRTSGRPSPTRHAGADALELVAPVLTREQLDAATKAIPIESRIWNPQSLEEAYGAARKALADRRTALAKE